MKRPAEIRTQLAYDHLLAGHSGSATSTYLAQREGISLRQSRRYVSAAYQRMLDDIEEIGIDRPKMIAQLVHGLQEALAKSLASEHTSAAIGAARELRELLELTSGNRT